MRVKYCITKIAEGKLTFVEIANTKERSIERMVELSNEYGVSHFVCRYNSMRTIYDRALYFAHSDENGIYQAFR